MAKIEAGVAVLIVGPTVNGGTEAIGSGGVVDRRVAEWDQTGPELFASANGWLVEFARPVDWGCLTTRSGIFPASSLLPLDTDAEDESERTDQPIPAEVA